jgi:hypothetical protein
VFLYPFFIDSGSVRAFAIWRLRSIGEIASIQQKRIIPLEQTFSASKKRLNTHTFMDLMPFLYPSTYPSIDSGRAYCLRATSIPSTIMIEKRGTGGARSGGVDLWPPRACTPSPLLLYVCILHPGMDHAYAESKQTDRPPLQQQLFAQALWIKIWARGNGTHNDNAMNGFCVSIRLE